VLHHRGRKSGTAYAIPVAIVPTHSREVFLIGLPWGERTKWAQNVLAAGGATLTWKGASYAATAPRIVGADVARELARSPFDRIVGSGRFPAFIELRRG
jgi:deazaflavin-dependent oxidoreductase (nitroreductase family)